MNQFSHSEIGLTHQLEAAKVQAQQLMQSKLGLLPERVDIDIRGITGFNPGLYPQDLRFRDSIREVFHVYQIRSNSLILLDLATQHTVAAADIFYERGFDMNYIFFPSEEVYPPNSPIESYYQPVVVQRVLEVLADEKQSSRIRYAKRDLNIGILNGIVLSVHSHSKEKDFEQSLKLYPTASTLQKLKITKVYYFNETEGSNPIGESEVSVNRRYVSELQKSGLFVNEVALVNKYPFHVGNPEGDWS